MVKGHCFTNLDEYNKKNDWPKVFSEGIRVGDRVMNIKRTRSMYVVGITHTEEDVHQMLPKQPYLIIELHIRRLE